ncbi:hypothetical protein EF898_14510, partial [Staphylococcus aureus]
LEDSFAINMTPFFKITEPKDNATAIKLFNDESSLNSEIKYRKRSVLEDSFAINMTPFFKITEPKDNATAIKLFNDESS